VGEFTLHAKLKIALEQKPEPVIIDLPEDDRRWEGPGTRRRCCLFRPWPQEGLEA
jgi:hypothetical protein